jgi:hypothetical protein
LAGLSRPEDALAAQQPVREKVVRRMRPRIFEKEPYGPLGECECLHISDIKFV